MSVCRACVTWGAKPETRLRAEPQTFGEESQSVAWLLHYMLLANAPRLPEGFSLLSISSLAGSPSHQSRTGMPSRHSLLTSSSG